MNQPTPNNYAPETLTFGKYLGQKFSDVMMNHPEYCHWVMMTSEMEESASQDLTNFADFLRMNGFGISTHVKTETQSYSESTSSKSKLG